jgi:hypothetical protein
MKIDHITQMVRVGEIKTQDGTKKLVFIPDLNMLKSQLRDKRGRVYAVVVDGVIEKLGGSQDAGGIQGTIGWYLNGWAKGNSERSYCTWNFFTKKINAGKKVEIYAVWAPMVDVEIPTMNGTITKTLPVDFHTIEKAFNDEYYKIEGKHPTLNMQESGQRWQDTGLLEGYINKDGTIYGSK